MNTIQQSSRVEPSVWLRNKQNEKQEHNSIVNVSQAKN